MDPNMLGAYGPWAASLVPDGPARLSFRNERYRDVDAWRREARGSFLAQLLQPESRGTPRADRHNQFMFDGLTVEHLHWTLPYGPPTEAFLLRPLRAPRGDSPPCSPCTTTAATSTSAPARSSGSATTRTR